jgi:small GTP-binding protein
MSEGAVIRYKVAIVGSGGVGKTTLLRRYATGKFRESRIMTIGVDFETIEVAIKEQPVKLTVWDLAGQERFAPFRDSFYKGARAVALVFDVHDRASFDDLPHWL